MIHKLKSLIGQRSPFRLSWHYVKAFLAALYYRFPARKLIVIGVTGTDGKTTTCGMIAHILSAQGIKTALASTAFTSIGGELQENKTHLTSLDARDLQRLLRQAVDAGCTHAVIEVSSHALVQGRALCTFPAIAGFTNIAPESLDYHGTMEKYIEDKGRLFHMLKGQGTKVINATDETFEKYSAIKSEDTVTYGTKDSDYWIENIEATKTTASADLVQQDGTSTKLSLTIPGTYNLYNAECAAGCVLALGTPLETSIEALSSFKGIPGRMQQVDCGQDFAVFVDFTVTAQSYERTLEGLRKAVGEENKVLVMCCSCGNRMAEKRPIVGKTCSDIADIVVVTEDETYGEDPIKVLEEVWAGIDQDACEAHKIFDRREAIAFLLSKANPGDAVIFCGMGPFTTFTKLEGRIPWHEPSVVEEELQKLLHG